jgi:phosphoesterase RecJ-like protein
MELTAKQQTIELIRRSEKILILTHMNPDGDALGSILALYLALKKVGKDVTAACSDQVSPTFEFLPAKTEINNSFGGAKDFIITIDTTNTEVDRLGYKQLPDEKKLNIIITPLKGTFNPQDVSFGYGTFKFDLVIVLDSPTLERIGRFYDDYAELFYEAPIINIDHHAGNDHFGKVNWVDMTSTSTAEILVALLESLGREKPLLDEDIATCLLAGIITDTASFQNANTTPKSFTVAAQLAGARQQEIIQNVYKTKPLSTLKLWGRILTEIHEEPKYRFIWSAVRAQDFSTLGAKESETSGVIDELLKTAPGIDFALLLTERANGIHGSLRGVRKGIDLSELAKIFNGGGHDLAAAFDVSAKKLDGYQDEILSKVRNFQAGRLQVEENIQK